MSRYFARRTESVQEHLTEATLWRTANSSDHGASSGSGEGDGHNPDAILDDFGFTRGGERSFVGSLPTIARSKRIGS